MIISRLFLPHAIRRQSPSALLGRAPFAFRRGFSMKGKSPLLIPDRIEDATGWIPRGAAIRRYCLDEDDLKEMEHMEKPNPYMPSSNEAMRLYRHHDVFAKAIDKYGSLEAVAKKAAEDHRKLVEWLHSHSAPAKAQNEAPKDRRLPARLDVWARTFTSNPGSSEKVVIVAIMGNFAVSLSKLLAFWFTGSASMLSEAVHSIADLANQCLLAVGLSESNKTPDALHPYGYASEKYVWALISGVGIFFLGCGVSLYHGFLGIIHPTDITYHPITPAVLGFSFLVEGATFMVALKEIQRAAKQFEMTTWQYIRRGPDPNTVAVLAEDAAAVCGIVVASGCITATHFTGLGIFDAVGSIAVGGLLGVVAMFLIRKNHEYLLGRSIHPSYTEKVLRILHESKVISSVHDVKAVFLGPDAFRFKAEIVVNGQTLSRLFLAQQHTVVPNAVDHSILILPRTQAELETTLIEFGDHLVHFLGDEIDQIEAEIKRAVPEIKHVDLEII